MVLHLQNGDLPYTPGTLNNKPTTYPASALSVPMIAISRPLLPGFPTVTLALYAPTANSVNAAVTMDTIMLIPTGRTKNGTSGINDPTIAAIPTISADLTAPP